MKKYIIHLKHCYIDNPESIWNVSYSEINYELRFTHGEFDAGKVVVLASEKGIIDDTYFLAWLSVFFGEDFTDPFQNEDTRKSFNRGRFKANQQLLQEFLDAAFQKITNQPKGWEKDLFEKTINYYVVGLRSGTSMMPLTMGFFGLSMECIGNLVSDQNEKCHMLGSFRFKKLINNCFESFKKDKEHGENFRAWQKEIEADSELVHAIRNAVYGHSLLHIPKERQHLVAHLHKWLKRAGAPQEDADFWFKVERLELDLQVQSAGLYKVGLRSSRLLIFLYLGIVTYIPFAEHDYRPFGEIVNDRTMKFNGISVSILKTEKISIIGETVQNGAQTDFSQSD